MKPSHRFSDCEMRLTNKVNIGTVRFEDSGIYDGEWGWRWAPDQEKIKIAPRGNCRHAGTMRIWA
jgi:hypothetical protein